MIKFKKLKSFIKFKISPIKYYFKKQKNRNIFKGFSGEAKKIEYFRHFSEADKKTTWDSSIFSKIIENELNNVDDLIIVELGVARGGTAKFTLDKLGNKVNKYFGIDPYLSRYDKYDQMSYMSDEGMEYLYLYVLDKLQKTNFQLLRTFSNLAVQSFADRSIDTIYIDGDHTYDGVKKDITLWEKKIVSGGIMVGDDYKRFEGVRKAVNESFEKFDVIGNTWFKKL